MEAEFLLGKKPKYGLLILGNVGVGKSYICNMIIGYQRFDVGFRREAVTTAVEYHRIDTGLSDLLIFNIPGLIASNQEEIDRNKKEIIKAFELCPISMVVFVWTHVNGRPQTDDIIAFKALQEACQFSPKSLVFIVNDIMSNRSSAYEGKFFVLLKQFLNPIPISLEDIFFLDALKSEDVDTFFATRIRLLYFIAQHQEHEQKLKADIILQYSQLRMIRETIEEQYIKFEQNEKTFRWEIRHMNCAYEALKNDQEKKYQDMMLKIEIGQQQVEEEDDDTDDEYDAVDLEISNDEKKSGRKERCRQLLKKVGDEKGIVKKVEKSYHIARHELVIKHKTDKNNDDAKNCKATGCIVESGNGKCARTSAPSAKKIQKKFNKLCHIKFDSNVKFTAVGGVAGAGLGCVAGAAVGGAVGLVLGPCAIATAAIGGVAGTAIGAIAGGAAGHAFGAVVDGAVSGAVVTLAGGAPGTVASGTTGDIRGAMIGHNKCHRQ